MHVAVPTGSRTSQPRKNFDMKVWAWEHGDLCGPGSQWVGCTTEWGRGPPGKTVARIPQGRVCRVPSHTEQSRNGFFPYRTFIHFS